MATWEYEAQQAIKERDYWRDRAKAAEARVGLLLASHDKRAHDRHPHRDPDSDLMGGPANGPHHD